MKSTNTEQKVAQINKSNKKSNTGVNIGVFQQQSFSGPLPAPQLLEAYNKIDPTFAERIMKMAKENNKSNIQQSNETFKGFFKEGTRGQWFCFILGLLSLATGIVLTVLGYSAPALTAMFGGIAPIVCSSISSLFRKNN